MSRCCPCRRPGVLEADYQALLRAVCADRVRLAAENRDRLEDMTDYYTLWAHQIKTPIAAARLLLQEDPGAVGTEVEVELLKIEQYVDMVLGYLRLDSESTDYVLRDTDLDGLLRQAVRKFARMFILKKITLDFRETGRTVLTDGKWLSFVVEQVLSNALKYTPAGAASGSTGTERRWSSPTAASVSGRRTCPGCSRRASPATTAGRTRNPPASGCTCAAG